MAFEFGDEEKVEKKMKEINDPYFFLEHEVLLCNRRQPIRWRNILNSLCTTSYTSVYLVYCFP